MTDFLQSAARAAAPDSDPLLPAEMARFDFEFAQPPDHDVIRATLVQALGGSQITLHSDDDDPLHLAVVFPNAEMPGATAAAEARHWLIQHTGASAAWSEDLAAPDVAPAAAADAIPASKDQNDQIARIALAQSGALESNAAIAPDAARAQLRARGANALLERAAQRFEALRGGPVDRAVQAEALARMRPVVEAMTDGGALPDVPREQADHVLEALVRLTGRPAMRLHPDIAPEDWAALGDWTARVAAPRDAWQATTDAVGRIDVETPDGTLVPVGTGILLSETHVLTNRHVIDLFVRAFRGPDGPIFRMPEVPVTINFDPSAVDPAQRFRVRAVATAGGHKIGRRMNLAKLDAAVLEINPDNGLQEPPLPVMPRFAGAQAAVGAGLLVSGYPLKPGSRAAPSQNSDPDGHAAFWARIDALYGTEFGVQYITPGEVMQPPGQVEFDVHGWAFTHDATTLGGNSGSVVMALSGEMPICGLHFSGHTMTANYAHDYQVVRARGDGVFDTGLLPGGPP